MRNKELALPARRDDFWVKVIPKKYNCGEDMLPRIDMSRPGWNLWSGIKRTWKKVQEGTEIMPNGGIRWKWNKSGSFSIKYAYNALVQEVAPPDPLWGKIWKLKVPERCRMFLWLVMHKRLLTNASRQKRGLVSDASCPVCNSGMETIQHVLRDCPGTLDLWRQVVPPQRWQKFCALPCEHWLRWNLRSSDGAQGKEDWRHLFTVLCWWAWRRRNSTVFEGKRMSNTAIISSDIAMMSSSNEAWSRLGTVTGRKAPHNDSVGAWRPPPPGWVKLNTDGAFSHRSSGIASGGLLRDDQSMFLKAFMFRGEAGDCLTAELWGCLHGLKLAWDLGFRNVILEVDSSDAVELINNPTSGAHEDSCLVAEIKGMFGREWCVELQLISRWANAAADQLAKASLSAMPGLQMISQVDVDLQKVLLQDNG